MTTASFDRDQLISDYVDRILDNMSTKDLMRIVGDQLEENFSSYSDEELIGEVEEYYPELLEGWSDMAKDRTIVETEYYELPLDFYLKCEYIAAQLEITVDYLLAEFYDDGELIVPDYVEEWAMNEDSLRAVH